MTRLMNLKGKRILIAEDDPFNRELMEDIFEDAQCTIVIASTGVEVVEKFKTEQYDLILMDVQMPDQDGYEATRTIRKIEKALNKKATPIIAITANALSGDRERCLKVGMDDYLPKPIKITELKKKIEAILGF